MPFTIEMLMTIAAVGALFIGAAEEAALVVFLFAVGEVLEGVAANRARASIRALSDLVPKSALLEVDGGTREVPSASLQVGQVILARPGDRITLAPGTYRGDFAARGLRGTADRPIVVAGDPMRPAVIVARNTGLHLSAVAHVEVRDLTVEGAKEILRDCMYDGMERKTSNGYRQNIWGAAPAMGRRTHGYEGRDQSGGVGDVREHAQAQFFRLLRAGAGDQGEGQEGEQGTRHITPGYQTS